MTRINDYTPIIGYQDNEISVQICDSIDWVTGNSEMVAFTTQITANLDFYGRALNRDYWRYDWDDSVKLAFLTNGVEIYKLRGTLAGLELAVSCLGVNANFIGSWFTIPVSVSPFSRLKKDVVAVVNAYEPVTNPVPVVYEQFYADISTVDEPVFT